MPADALPAEADGSIERGVAALDATLRGFEGTHRFHNFASGLRKLRGGGGGG